MNRALWDKEQKTADPDFYNKVLWSDEATFKSNGNVNRPNMHLWNVENPHWMREMDNQMYWTLNTWCGVYNGKIIGPKFFLNNLNGLKTYQSFDCASLHEQKGGHFAFEICVTSIFVHTNIQEVIVWPM